MRSHQARGPRSLPLDLPDLRQRLGTLTLCLLILAVWLFRYTGDESKGGLGAEAFRISQFSRQEFRKTFIFLFAWLPPVRM